MKEETDRSYQRDIACLNQQYISILRDSLNADVLSDNLFKCRLSAIETIRGIDQVAPIAACNVLQYKIACNSNTSNETTTKQFQKIIRDTLLFYREITKTVPKHTESITGLRLSDASSFANLSYSEIEQLSKSNECQIQMRFFDSYWERVCDIASDSPVSLQLISAAQAATEAFSNRFEGGK